MITTYYVNNRTENVKYHNLTNAQRISIIRMIETCGHDYEEGAYELTKEEIVAILLQQDEEFNKILKEREALNQMCKEKSNAFYDEVWETLFRDGNSHWSF